jgi:hypothetical protein
MPESIEREQIIDRNTPEGQAAISRRRQELEEARQQYGIYAMRAAAIEADDVNER